MSLMEDFKERFKDDFSEDVIEKHLPIFAKSYKTFYEASYGVSANDDEAILYLIAHLIFCKTLNNSGNFPILATQSDSVDGVASSNYPLNNLSAIDAFLYSSNFGQMFKLSIESNFGGVFI